jgi:creatinine amidohydrolase
MPHSRPPFAAWRGASGARIALAASLALACALGLAGRPLTAPFAGKTEIGEMTWVEVRSAIEHGYTTVIVPSGGIEQNGPHMITAKHDHIVRWVAGQVAAGLGRTLVAPVVSYVPQGSYDPPSDHLRYPGTIGVPESVFAATLEGIARSLKAGGFRTICFVADHGPSVKPQRDTADKLNREWAGQGIRVVSVDQAQAVAEQDGLLIGEGETPDTLGQHAGIADTSEVMAVHPAGVDLDRWRRRPLTWEDTGVSGDPARASPERGRALLAIKVEAAIRQIRAAAAGS